MGHRGAISKVMERLINVFGVVLAIYLSRFICLIEVEFEGPVKHESFKDSLIL